jgi:hypothetical protein
MRLRYCFGGLYALPLYKYIEGAAALAHVLCCFMNVPVSDISICLRVKIYLSMYTSLSVYIHIYLRICNYLRYVCIYTYFRSICGITFLYLVYLSIYRLYKTASTVLLLQHALTIATLGGATRCPLDCTTKGVLHARVRCN